MAGVVIHGAVAALFTPFTTRGESIDEGALRAHVEWLLGNGIHGLMTCGTTGEGPLLTNAERRRVLELVVDVTAGRVPVIAHIGSLTTRETIDLARHAVDCGAAAVSVVTPLYYRLADAELIAHYCTVADSVPETSVFLYNIPQYTGNRISVAVAEAVACRCPNVVGIKDSAGDLAHLLSFVSVRGGSFQVICGSDELILQALEGGACASVSGNANVVPDLVVPLFEAFWRGDREGARCWQERLDEVRRELCSNGLSLMKRGLDLRGLRGGCVRPPLLEADDTAVERLRRRLGALGLL